MSVGLWTPSQSGALQAPANPPHSLIAVSYRTRLEMMVRAWCRLDNCVLVKNRGQADGDGDGIGDSCDLDGKRC